MILPILFIWSLTTLARDRQNIKSLLLILTASIFSFFMFFYFPENQLEIGSSLKLTISIESVLSVIKSYLIATGGYLHFEILALLSGLIINIYFVALLVLRYFQKNPVIFYTFLYILLSTMLIALFRHEMGLKQLIASRYQIFTITLNALVVISLFELGLEKLLPFRYLKQTILSMFMALYFSSFYYISNLENEKERILIGLHDWNTNDAPSLHHPQPERASEILSLAVDAGIYSVPRAID
ncbi:MAG: hypothetical protein COC19_01175 [SAR86 cluster bacterium]|uniref:Uncharacterized protein n=1 Tax=SAR86 cluster bacterium TaxID=2030880 RepID=A0A2A4MTR6_9GAMM|nr:MAG: hypothetical protein COC19_01175 [SAR86 cluster bacterium]